MNLLKALEGILLVATAFATLACPQNKSPKYVLTFGCLYWAVFGAWLCHRFLRPVDVTPRFDFGLPVRPGVLNNNLKLIGVKTQMLRVTSCHLPALVKPFV